MKIFIYMICLLSTGVIYSQTTPIDTVQFALQSMTNGDIEKLLDITENAELRQVKELLVTLGDSTGKKEKLLQQYRNLKSWTIENSSEHNVNGRNITIVNTKWEVTVPVEYDPKNLDKSTQRQKTLYIDYMLEKFDNKWKIISRKSQG